MDEGTIASSTRGFGRIPLLLQLGIAALVGTALGAFFGDRPYFPGGSFGNAELSLLATFVVTMIKTLAPPLIFFAVLDAFLRTDITWERGRSLLFYCMMNVSAAMLIGLCVMNVWRPGEAWTEQLSQPSSQSTVHGQGSPMALASPAATIHVPKGISVREIVERMIPTNVIQPFIEGNLMSLMILAVLVGCGLRVVRRQQHEAGSDSFRSLENVVESLFQVLLHVLEWVVQLVPFAVCGALAQSVATTGSDVFRLVGVFLAAISLGLALHALIYYSFVVSWIGHKRVFDFWRHSAEPVVTALSSHSSLATIPVTLRALTERLNVSDQSARLATCVGTNLNNDGITLYEAMTAIFLAQAAGLHLTISGQIMVVASCVLASLGAAGIPHGGLAVLPLVLSTTGLSPETITKSMPLILTVDWIVGRLRSGVNVLGDMTVAIQLDRNRSDTPVADRTTEVNRRP